MDYLAIHGSATPGEIGRSLKMPSVNVRHHLSVLQEQGAVQVSGEIRLEGRGRPARLYVLSSQAEEHNLDRLSGLLLDEIVAVPSAEPHSRLERIARKLAGDAPADSRASLTSRLYQAVSRLNELHYQARWEAHAAAPHLILGRCPFGAIIAAHPELCQMDAAMIEALLKVPVAQTAKLEPDGRGRHYCVFVVSKPS
jgi:predicted ArsR family transcriptional regulator